MNSREKIVLSSLVLSVSAVALLGVSELAKADPPGACNLQSSCYLDFQPTEFFQSWGNEPEAYGDSEVYELWGICRQPGGYVQCICRGTYNVRIDQFDPWGEPYDVVWTNRTIESAGHPDCISGQ